MCPFTLGFNENGNSKVPPYTDLIFEIEVIDWLGSNMNIRPLTDMPKTSTD